MIATKYRNPAPIRNVAVDVRADHLAGQDLFKTINELGVDLVAQLRLQRARARMHRPPVHPPP